MGLDFDTTNLLAEKFKLTRVETIDEITITPKEYWTFPQTGTQIVNVVNAIGGLYDLQINFVCRNTSNNGSVVVDTVLNGTSVFDQPTSIEPDEGTNTYQISISKEVTLLVGNNTLQLNLSNLNNGTARIYEATLYLTQIV